MSNLRMHAVALAAALDEQRALYVQMEEIAQGQQHALLDSDVNGLTQLVERQEQLIEHLSVLETDRMTAVAAIAAATGRDVDAISLSEIADALPRREADVVRAAGAALRVQAQRAAALNAENARLLRTSRALVDRWIGYLRGMLTRQIAYGADGAVRGTADKARVLDRSV